MSVQQCEVLTKEGVHEQPEVTLVSEMERLAEIARVEAKRLAEIARDEEERLAEIAQDEEERLAKLELEKRFRPFTMAYLSQKEKQIQEAKQKILHRIAKDESVPVAVAKTEEDQEDEEDEEDDDYDGLTVLDLQQLLFLLNFLNVDFLVSLNVDFFRRNDHFFDLIKLPDYKVYDCCMDCCNTTEEEEWEYYTDTIPRKIDEFLYLVKWNMLELEIDEELSPTLHDHIQKKGTHFFHNYRDFDCVVFDITDKKLKNINFLDLQQTQFRLLVSVLLYICENV
jgi:hypothetical protein